MSVPTVHPLPGRRARRAHERLVWRAIRIHPATRAAVVAAAWIWRRLLFRTTFLAVTGSHGKTTAKECLAEMLGTLRPTARSKGNQNDHLGLCVSLLRVRPWHRFAVLELSTSKPGQLQRYARLVRPDVGIVLDVLRAHSAAFPTLEDVAAEKQQVFAALRPGGVAIVNRDDPRVAAMPLPPGVRAITVGTSPDCDLWADEAASRWPDRFGFRAHRGESTVRVETQLVGVHWLPSVLAALAAAEACGVPLPAAAEAARRTPPFPARLEPVNLPGGAVVLRDDYNGSVDTLDPACRVLAEARATRKLFVVQDYSDSRERRTHRLKRLALEAARCADVAFFIGESAEYGRRRAIEAGMRPEDVHALVSRRAATELLTAELRPGDLVLVKGRTTDHLARLVLSQLGEVGCQKSSCAKTVLCDFCEELAFRPHAAPAVAPHAPG